MSSDLTLQELDEKIEQKSRDIVAYGYMRHSGESWDACWHEAVARKRKLIEQRNQLTESQKQ